MSSLSQRGGEIAQDFYQRHQAEEKPVEVPFVLTDFIALSSSFPWKDLGHSLWPKFEFTEQEGIVFCSFRGEPLPFGKSVLAILGSFEELFDRSPLAKLMDFPFRELENFLRDHNHQPTWSDEEISLFQEFFRDEKVLLGVQSLISQRPKGNSEALFDSRDLVEEVAFLKDWTGSLSSLYDPLSAFSPSTDLQLFDVNDAEVVFSLVPRKPLGTAQIELWERIWSAFFRVELSSVFELRGRKVVAEARQMT